MKQWNTAGVLLVALMAGCAVPTAQAENVNTRSDVNQAMHPELKNSSKWIQAFYAGAGLQNAFIHLGAEAVTPYGNIYTKVGQFYKGEGVAGQVGFRMPYYLTGGGNNKDGYYFGGFIGNVDSVGYSVPVSNSAGETKLKSKHKNRLGLGAELSYVWQNTQRLSAASVALVVAQSQTVGSGNYSQDLSTSPMIMFGYTFQFSLF